MSAILLHLHVYVATPSDTSGISTFATRLASLISSLYNEIVPADLLDIIFNTNKGINYIKFLAPFFIFLYIEGPLQSTLQALNYSKYTMLVTIITTIIKMITLFIFSLFHIGLYGLLISEIINIFLVVYLNTIKIKKILK